MGCVAWIVPVYAVLLSILWWMTVTELERVMIENAQLEMDLQYAPPAWMDGESECPNGYAMTARATASVQCAPFAPIELVPHEFWFHAAHACPYGYKDSGAVEGHAGHKCTMKQELEKGAFHVKGEACPPGHETLEALDSHWKTCVSRVNAVKPPELWVPMKERCPPAYADTGRDIRAGLRACSRRRTVVVHVDPRRVWNFTALIGPREGAIAHLRGVNAEMVLEIDEATKDHLDSPLLEFIFEITRAWLLLATSQCIAFWRGLFSLCAAGLALLKDMQFL